MIKPPPTMPPDVAAALEAFCAPVYMMPTSPASGGHPNDRARFVRFVALAHQRKVETSVGELRDYFRARGGGERADERADDFVRDYELGRQLLEEYDSLRD